MKKLIFCALLFAAHMGFAQKLHLCFTSTDSAFIEDPMQLSFNVIDKDWANGFVQYKGQQDAFLLSFAVEKVLEKNDSLPPKVEYSFNEFKNGKTTGKYFIAITGSKVDYFYYYDKQRKTKINFAQDFSAGEKCGCSW